MSFLEQVDAVNAKLKKNIVYSSLLKHPHIHDTETAPVNSKKLKSTHEHEDSSFYGQSEEERIKQLGKMIETAFLSIYPDEIQPSHIHNFYLCKLRNCQNISEKSKKTMKKDNKFQHRWLFDNEISKCPETNIWCLTYIDGKGMFCALCRLNNTCLPSNSSKVWNTEPNVRCRTETIRGHLRSQSTSRTMHSDAVTSELLKYKSVFVKQKKEEEQNINIVYEKVFRSLYWIGKEEIATSKMKSLLTLLEKLGVEDIKQFRSRSEQVLRQMIVLLADIILEDLVQNIKKSVGFGILTDEVTDISNIQQLLTFVKYYNVEKGEASTCFVGSTDLLAESRETSANAQSIFESLVNLLDRLALDKRELKAFASDGASVMTGRIEGVGSRFRRLEECKTMLSVHCICHRLALACCDTGDELSFIKDFETTVTQLWAFFKNSAKRLKVYIKVAMQCKLLQSSALSKKRKRNAVKRVKKAVRTRWLSLHASVDSIFEEYVGLINALRRLKDDPNSGAMAGGLLKKIDCTKFLGTLYMFKKVLPHLSALSKTFQTGSINFSRIKPGISKVHANLQKILKDDAIVTSLKEDISESGRLHLCDATLSERDENHIRANVQKYITSLTENISNRFPASSTEVLNSFCVFNVELLPTETDSELFLFYGDMEIKALKHHFFSSDPTASQELEDQWGNFKYELLELKKKWFHLKRQIEANKMKMKCTSTEWALRQILALFQDSTEYTHIVSIAKTALVTPVSNAWPERAGSAIKRIKSRYRSTMKTDLLNALLIISINGPDVHSQNADQLVRKATQRFASSRRYKRPSKLKVNPHSHNQPGVSTSTQTHENEDVDTVATTENEILEFEKQLQESLKNTEPWLGESDCSSCEEDSSDEEMDC